MTMQVNSRVTTRSGGAFGTKHGRIVRISNDLSTVTVLWDGKNKPVNVPYLSVQPEVKGAPWGARVIYTPGNGGQES